MGLFGDLGRAYAEGLALKRLGPNWRQEQALRQAQVDMIPGQMEGQQNDLEIQRGRIAANEADLHRTRIQTEGAELGNEHLRAQIQAEELKLTEARRILDTKNELRRQGKLKDEGQMELEEQLYNESKRKLDLLRSKAEIDHTNAQTRASNSIADLNKEKGDAFGGLNLTGAKWMTDPRTGGRILIDRRGQDVTNLVGEAGVAPPPTADQVNQERYEVILPTTFNLIQTSLDNIKKLSGPDKAMSLIPGTKGYAEVEQYRRLVQGLAATVGRAQGDNRITDADRPVYSSMLGVLSRAVVTDPGSELAQQLLDSMKVLQSNLTQARIDARRNNSRGPVIDGNNVDAGAGSSTGTIVNRRKVTGVRKVAD